MVFFKKTASIKRKSQKFHVFFRDILLLKMKMAGKTGHFLKNLKND